MEHLFKFGKCKRCGLPAESSPIECTGRIIKHDFSNDMLCSKCGASESYITFQAPKFDECSESYQEIKLPRAAHEFNWRSECIKCGLSLGYIQANAADQNNCSGIPGNVTGIVGSITKQRPHIWSGDGIERCTVCGLSKREILAIKGNMLVCYGKPNPLPNRKNTDYEGPSKDSKPTVILQPVTKPPLRIVKLED